MNIIDEMVHRAKGDYSHRTQVGGQHSPSEKRNMKRMPVRVIVVKGRAIEVEVVKTK